MAAAKKQSQALAIKLSRERRAGKEIPPPPKGRYSERARKKAVHDLEIGRQRKRRKAARKRTTTTARRGTKKRSTRGRGS